MRAFHRKNERFLRNLSCDGVFSEQLGEESSRNHAQGTGPTDSGLPCLQASGEQTSRPHSLGVFRDHRNSEDSERFASAIQLTFPTERRIATDAGNGPKGLVGARSFHCGNDQEFHGPTARQECQILAGLTPYRSLALC